MNNKRFIVKEDSFTDKLTKKTYYELSDIIDLCNKLWEQTQRFEKYNQRLVKENMELKERNNRQYKQLNQLYRLIEEENWEILKQMINELKENEKQLQREWKYYNGE